MTMVGHPEGFEIPAQGTLVLEPGGKHIMLMGLQDLPKSGQPVTLRLQFEHAGIVEVQAVMEGA